MSDYYVHRLQISISLETAEAIANGAIAIGREILLLPVCIENLNPDIVVMKPAKDWA